MAEICTIPSKQTKRAIEKQSKYYDKHYTSVNFDVGQLVLLITINLQMKTGIKSVGALESAPML